ncbi:MAG: protein-glutamate O-methyltransferase CheR [Lachnospiraceae bacterium]|nr:protein-glutamate O-methyltransferase CheR [Lachnospiraceae bacterium]
MITEQEFHRIVVYVKQKYGIDLSGKQVLVNGRMENYLLRNGYNGYDEYMAKVEKNPKGEEARNLINVLTTNHTYFMREFEHMDFMRKVILPQIKAKEAASKDVRIWSAASSTGEEPYTIAMVLKDYFGLEHSRWDTRVLATDLSTKVLEKAQKGIYLKEQIEPLPESWKRRYFKRVSEMEYQAKQELKQELIFRQFNLMNSFPFRKKFHIVFMRNVMIYFDDATKHQLLLKVYDCLEPGGYLFVGTTESVDRKGTNFKYVEPSIYRK